MEFFPEVRSITLLAEERYMTQATTPEDYPFIARLLENGYAVSLGGGVGERGWVTVCDEGGGLIMFEKGKNDLTTGHGETGAVRAGTIG